MSLTETNKAHNQKALKSAYVLVGTKHKVST